LNHGQERKLAPRTKGQYSPYAKNLPRGFLVLCQEFAKKSKNITTQIQPSWSPQNGNIKLESRFYN
jgi:hypothetical protein